MTATDNSYNQRRKEINVKQEESAGKECALLNWKAIL